MEHFSENRMSVKAPGLNQERKINVMTHLSNNFSTKGYITRIDVKKVRVKRQRSMKPFCV